MQRLLHKHLTRAIRAAYPELPVTATATVALSKTHNIDYGDASALKFSKFLSSTPHDVATTIASHIPASAIGPSQIFGSLEVTDKGFLNISIGEQWLCNETTTVAHQGLSSVRSHESNAKDESTTTNLKKIIVDFASPNVGKQLHAGHLRSSVIGDTICRMFEYQGHEVLRVSHVGDVGLPVALLVAHGLDQKIPWMLNATTDLPTAKELSDLYVAAKHRSTEDTAFHDFVWATLQVLQQGTLVDNATPDTGTDHADHTDHTDHTDEGFQKIERAWRRVKDASRLEHSEIFEQLGIQVAERPESMYTPALEAVVNELLDANIAEMSDGATCIFPLVDDAQQKKEKGKGKGKENKKNKKKHKKGTQHKKDKQGDTPPMLVRKTDGSWLYGTIDLAAVRQRLLTEQADRIVYVTDEGQRFHFSQVFDVAERASWTNRDAGTLQHVGFGLVKAMDGTKLSSRDGNALPLSELLRRAAREAKQALHRDDSGTNSDTVDSTITTKDGRSMLLSEAVGTSALRYYDLRAGRKPYKLNFEAMLAFRGNTSVYLQYALTRIKSIQKKVMAHKHSHKASQDDPGDAHDDDVRFEQFETPVEKKLALTLMQFNDVVEVAANNATPHMLCEYLYVVAKTFHGFYEECPVANSSHEKERLILLKATEQVLGTGMNLLGVIELDRM